MSEAYSEAPDKFSPIISCAAKQDNEDNMIKKRTAAIKIKLKNGKVLYVLGEDGQ